MSRSHPAKPTVAEAPGRWTILILLVTVTLVSYVNRQAVTLLVEPLKRDLGIDDRQIAFLIGASFAIVYAVCSLGFGWLADRLNRYRIIAGAMIVWSVASGLSGLARGFQPLFLCRMLIGGSEAALLPAALSLIADSFSADRRGIATGTFLVGVFGGAGGAIIVVGWLLQVAHVGLLDLLHLPPQAWRRVFILAALPGLALAPIFMLLKDPRGDRRSSDRHVQAGETASRTGRTPRTVWHAVAALCAALTLLSLSDNAVIAWVPTLMIRDHGLSAEIVGRYLGLSLMVGGAAGVLIGGLISDRLGGGVLPAAGAVLLAGMAMLSLLAGRTSLLIAGVGLYLSASAAATCVGVAALMGNAPAERRGLIASIMTLSTVTIGFGLGPSLPVWLMPLTGGLAYGLAAASLSSLLLAFIMFLSLARKRL